MKETDIATSARLASLRTKLPENTQLSLEGITKQLLKAGFNLPSTGEQVSHFLLEKAESGLKISTLRNYCSILIKWHRMADYAEAASDISVKAPPVIKGLLRERIEAGKREFRESARPLLSEDALKIDDYLLDRFESASASEVGIAAQDLALFRILWWSGCREDEIAKLKYWQINIKSNPSRIELSWDITKTNQSGIGSSRLIPGLPNADPAGAMQDWLELYWPFGKIDSKKDKYVFIRKDQRGNWREKHIHPNSIPTWLRKIAKKAGVSYWQELSGHSCRHGLSMKLADNLTLREIMDYFKWKRPETALGYMSNKGVSDNVFSLLESVSMSGKTIRKDKIVGSK